MSTSFPSLRILFILFIACLLFTIVRLSIFSFYVSIKIDNSFTVRRNNNIINANVLLADNTYYIPLHTSLECLGFTVHNIEDFARIYYYELTGDTIGTPTWSYPLVFLYEASIVDIVQLPTGSYSYSVDIKSPTLLSSDMCLDYIGTDNNTYSIDETIWSIVGSSISHSNPNYSYPSVNIYNIMKYDIYYETACRGSYILYVDDIYFDLRIIYHNETVYLPYEILSDILGIPILYDGDLKSILINTPCDKEATVASLVHNDGLICITLYSDGILKKYTLDVRAVDPLIVVGDTVKFIYYPNIMDNIEYPLRIHIMK